MSSAQTTSTTSTTRSYSSNLITVTNNADFAAAIYNTKYTATIVYMGKTTCGYSKYMKVKL